MQTQVLANVGLLMIFWQLPVLIIALLPTILLESVVARLHMKRPFLSLLGGTAAANAVSTFVGIPLAWLTMVLIEIFSGSDGAYGFATPFASFRSVVIQAAWLIPYEDEFYWLIPTATLVLLVPYFAASILVEWLVLRKIWKAEPSRRVFTTAWRINLVSYAGLLAVTLLWLAQNLEPYRLAE